MKLHEIIKKYNDYIPGNGSVYSQEDIKMYILVNIYPYNLSSGKIAAQVGHAIQDITENIKTLGDKSIKKRWSSYKKAGSAKIVLKVSETDLIEILEQTENIRKVYIVDAGRTQCPEGTVTCVGFFPLYQHEIPKYFRNLKLL